MATSKIKRELVIKSGWGTLESIPAFTLKSVDVTFNSPFPNTDYIVIVSHADTLGGFADVTLSAKAQDKSPTGFKVKGFNNSAVATEGISFFWMAVGYSDD